MVYPLNHSKVTVEDANVRFEFTTDCANVGSTDGGKTHFINTASLHNMVKTHLPEKDTVTPPTTQPEPFVTSNQDAALRHVILMARKVERTKLANARRVEEAQEAGQAALNLWAHNFNEAVLSATHEGLTGDTIVAHLESQDIHGLDYTVTTAAQHDWDVLYPSVED